MLDRLKYICKKIWSIRVIHFELITHVHLQEPVIQTPCITNPSPIGTVELIDELDSMRTEYRRLHKSAIQAQKQQALELAAKRFVNKEIDNVVR